MDAGRGKTWLEVALNGPWSRAHRAHIPVTVKEIVEQGIACVKAGAAIVHVHACDEGDASRTGDPGSYAQIIEGIRNKVDAIVYPAFPTADFAGQAGGTPPQRRFAHVEALARRRLIERMPVDPGSVNFSLYDDLREDRPGFVHVNSEEDARHGLRLAARYGLHPSYAIYEPGFARLGATLHWRESCPAPVYRFMFSNDYTFSFPPEDYALTAYLKLLDQVAPGAQWMVAGLQVDILPMIPRVAAEGGHVRVGLQDALPGCELSNPQLVEQAARKILDIGGELATAAEVRSSLDPDEHAAV
jgi:uncharacterized protein (DUF849 family)